MTQAKTKKTATKKKRGRPTLYSKELADKIIDLIESGVSETKISKKNGMPSLRTLQNWKDKYPDFLQRSARARQTSAEMFRDEALKIAYDTAQFAEDVANHKKLTIGGIPLCDIPKGYVDAKKLLIQELNREAALRDDSRFGDRKRVQMTGKDDGPIEVKQEVDLTSVTTENLKAVREMLYGAKTADTD